MPRTVDYERTGATDWAEVALDPPRRGRLEVGDAELRALAEASGGPVHGFWPQFSTRGGRRDETRAETGRRLDAAHAWLDANATGAWLWTDTWSNHGHALEARVWVEREPDRVALAGAFPDILSHRPEDEGDARRQAFVRGVVRPYDERESFMVWTNARRGVNLTGDGPPWRLAFTHEGMRAAFERDWAGRWEAPADDAADGATHVATGEARRGELLSWLDENAPVGSMGGGPTRDGYAWKVEVRYPDVAEEMRRDWGGHFRSKDGRRFVAGDLPSPPARATPQDYLDYLAGRREDYAAPHLPAGAPTPPGAVR